MVEKKSTGKGKVKSTARGKSAAKSKLLCAGKLSDGSPCPKTVEKGKVFCLWHNSEDETWGEIYTHLETTPPEQKTNIVLGFIKSHPEHKLELPVWNGQTADLSGVDLSNVDLQNAYLLKANLQEAVLRATNLRGAFLAHANLQDAFLEDADLQDANLMYTTLQGSNLKNANLESADLKYADIHKAHLENANCRQTKFLEANLQGADLQGANLQEADLMYAKLQNAYLNRANLQRSHFEKANLQGSDFGGADLRNAYFYAANLQGAKLSLANLQGTQLDGANLQECDLMHANLKDASLVNAKLQGVDLTNANSLSNIYLNGAWLDRTRLFREQLGASVGEERDGNYVFAKRAYLTLKQNFDDLGDYEASSWAYCKERQMEKLEARKNGNYFKYFGDTFVELLCNYGESVGQIIFWMAILLLFAGPVLFSGLGGIIWSKELTQEYFALSTLGRFLFLYWHYLLYTLA